jgi:hypothetical protein
MSAATSQQTSTNGSVDPASGSVVACLPGRTRAA